MTKIGAFLVPSGNGWSSAGGGRIPAEVAGLGGWAISGSRAGHGGDCGDRGELLLGDPTSKSVGCR